MNGPAQNLELRSLFDECNRLYFDGVLNAGLLVGLKWVDCDDHGYCYKHKGEQLISIDVSPVFFGEGMVNELRRLLVHELIHFLQLQRYFETGDESYLDILAGGHGKYFLSMASKINIKEPELDISAVLERWSKKAVLGAPVVGVIVVYRSMNDHEFYCCYRSAGELRVGAMLKSLRVKFGARLGEVIYFETRSLESLSFIKLLSNSRVPLHSKILKFNRENVKWMLKHPSTKTKKLNISDIN